MWNHPASRAHGWLASRGLGAASLWARAALGKPGLILALITARRLQTWHSNLPVKMGST